MEGLVMLFPRLDLSSGGLVAIPGKIATREHYSSQLCWESMHFSGKS